MTRPGKLLIGPPQPAPKWPMYVGVGLIWCATVVGAYGYGVVRTLTTDSEVAHEATVAQDMLRQCLSASSAVAWDATVALVYTRDAQDAIDSFLGEYPEARGEQFAGRDE